MHNTIIEIDSRQLIRNIQIIKDCVKFKSNSNCISANFYSKNTRLPLFCLPIKANAYGHGLVGVAKLTENYVDYFAVACVDEGVTLRQSGIKKPILVFGTFSQEQLPNFCKYDLQITISSIYKAKEVVEFCQSSKQTIKAHIKTDVGMNRIGIRTENVNQLIDIILAEGSKFINLVGLYSHLSCSDIPDDIYTKEQISKFSMCVSYMKQLNPDIICHLANSGGVCYYPESLFDMVRPGILSYGYAPNQLDIPQDFCGIGSCFSLKSRVVYFKTVLPNQGVSYGRTYITKQITHIVTIPIGYGDGYMRILSNKAPVLIKGKLYYASGTICMDMFMVDIGFSDPVFINDEVILIGTQGEYSISVEDIAQLCNTINYEILCAFSSRIPRIYI